MPRKPIADNSYGAKSLFRERSYYKSEILNPRQQGNVIDLWNPVFRDYGKVNLQNQRVRIDTRFLKKMARDHGDDSSFALNFVADAWSDLRDYCAAAAEGPRNQVIRADSRYAKITVNRQNMWKPLENSYHDHLRLIFNPFVTEFLQFHEHRKRVRTIKDFLEMFLQYARDLRLAVPLTKTGFTDSKYGPVNFNGLMIEIEGNKLHADDGAKWAWINDGGFNFWVRGCAMHGFLVDRNAPWRIIANLESKKMAKYAEPYGVNSLPEIFDKFFILTFEDDLEELKTFMYAFYRSYLRFEPYFMEHKFLVNHKRTETTQNFRIAIDKQTFFKKYGNLFWMRFWFLLRSHEYGVSFTDNKQKDILRTAFKIEKELDINAAMGYIVRVLRKAAGLGGPPEKTFIRREGDRQIIVKS